MLSHRDEEMWQRNLDHTLPHSDHGTTASQILRGRIHVCSIRDSPEAIAPANKESRIISQLNILIILLPGTLGRKAEPR